MDRHDARAVTAYAGVKSSVERNRSPMSALVSLGRGSNHDSGIPGVVMSSRGRGPGRWCVDDRVAAACSPPSAYRAIVAGGAVRRLDGDPTLVAGMVHHYLR